MTPEQLKAHCLAKPGAWADQPWEGDFVAKVGDKIFAFMGTDGVGIKCGANRAEADEELLEAVDASYDTIVAKLPKSRRPPQV